MKKNGIELNPEFKRALQLLEQTSKSVFITGKAGTGKSTLLDYFRNITRKKTIVLAPTGVAALNVRGETIHSFFKFKPNISPQKIKPVSAKRKRLYQAVETLIIDEVSMVRADLLDCVDAFLRRNGKHRAAPFGGVQMVFIGDLYQLPPVVAAAEKELFTAQYESPYFFSASALRDLPLEFIELEKIYRQKDEHFIELLNAIRNNSVTAAHLERLNTRAAVLPPRHQSGFTVHLTTTNKAAEEINQKHLQYVKGKVHAYGAEIEGDFDTFSYPTLSDLRIGIGAQVMTLNNDSAGRWVNGSIGEVTGIDKKAPQADRILVKFPDGRTEEVTPFAWEMFHSTYNEHARAIETETVGTFTQYPLKLAWALTIHKSQGKTFDRVVIDMGPAAFAGGQTYVALSRCTSFEGVYLKRPILKHHVFVDRRVSAFLTGYQYALSERALALEDKMSLIQEAIRRGKHLKITYLKKNDEKTRRLIKPQSAGEMMYEDKLFIGMQAYCLHRREDRVFRVDRILEMSIAEH